MKIRHFSLFCVIAKIWIQTCNSSLFFLCTWQNKIYVLTNLDSGLSNLTTKMLKIDPLCQNGCILFIVVYSCSPRKTLSILELECVKTRIISNERFKLFNIYHTVSIQQSLKPSSYSEIIASSNLILFSFTDLYS